MNQLIYNKKRILGICFLLFLILTYGIGPTRLFGLGLIIEDTTGYIFLVTTYILEYGLLSLIPFFGVILSEKRAKLSYTDIIIDSSKILLSVICMLIIGFVILTYIGKPSSPIIPQYLISEPIIIYTAFFIGIGIGIPFLLTKRIIPADAIDDIGTDN